MDNHAKPTHTGRNIAIILLCVVVVICAIYVVTLLNDYEQGDSIYDSISQIAIGKSPQISDENTSIPLDQIDFSALKEINPRVVGWLQLPDTVINYPVVQHDTNEYYLSHAFDGQASNFGAIFLDYRNKTDFSDKNIIIYGHRMKNGSMFGSLLEYENQDYYRLHPYFILYTPEKNYYIEIFSAHQVLYNEDYIRTQFESDEEFKAFVDDLQAKSVIETNVFVSRKDSIITLSTCTKASDNHRFAIHGKLKEIN